MKAATFVYVDIANPQDIYAPVTTQLGLLSQMQGQISAAVGSLDASATSVAAMAADHDAAFDQFVTSYGGLAGDLQNLNQQMAAAINQMSTAPIVAAVNQLSAQNVTVGNQLAVHFNGMRNDIQTLTSSVDTHLGNVGNSLTNLSQLTNVSVMTNLLPLTNFNHTATNFLNSSFLLSNNLALFEQLLSNSVTATNNIVLTNVFTNNFVGADVLTNDMRRSREALENIEARGDDWQASDFNDTNHWMGFQSFVDNSTLGGFADGIEQDIGVHAAAMPVGNASELVVTLPNLGVMDFQFSSLPYYGSWSPVMWNLATIMCIGMFLWFVLREGREAIAAAGGFKQLAFPNIQIFGNSVGWVAIPVYLTAIMLLVLAVPIFVVGVYNGAWLTDVSWAAILVNPFQLLAGISPFVAAFIGQINDLLPVTLMLTLAGAAFAVKALMAGMLQLASMGIRAMPS